MAPTIVSRKWRPPLALIVFGVLLSVLTLPVAIVVGFRALDNTASRMGPLELGALLVALVLTLVIALVFSRTITGPINALVHWTQQIGPEGRAAAVPIERQGTREIAVLSQSFLDLTGRLVDRSAYVRSFAAHVSHELKSPLTAIKGAAELLRDAEAGGTPLTPEQRQRFLDHMIADADRLARLLERLRELARAEGLSVHGKTSLVPVLAALQQRFPNLLIEGSCQIDAEVAMPTETLVIVLTHLADNAVRHGARSLRLQAAADDQTVSLLVGDDGEGVSPANRDKIFQPFFTTRREEGGTGMGLEIVRTMLGVHGGSIALVESAQGASFEIMLPRG